MTNNTPAVVLTADDTTAAALIATIKGVVNGHGKYAAYVKAHNVTRETVKDHAAALAALAYPNDKPVQTVKDENGNKTRTRYGNAVQAAANGLRHVLPKAESKPVDLLAALAKAVDRAAEAGHTLDEIMAVVSPEVAAALKSGALGMAA